MATPVLQLPTFVWVMGIARTESVETSGELAARFVRDAIPLLDELRGSAARMTRCRADAEDLLQETALKAYANFESFQPGTHLKAWLYRIMCNARINTYRATQRRPTEFLTDDVFDSHVVAADARSGAGSRSVESEALKMVMDSEIAAALGALPEQSRIAVHYAYVERLRYREIAEVMDIPLGTVMSRLHRARQHLRSLLVDVAHERGFVRRSGNGTADATTDI